MTEKKHKISFLGIFLIVLGLCLILPGCFLTMQVPDHYQYIVSAGEVNETWQGASKAVESFAEMVDVASVSGRRQNIQLPGVMEEVNITLYAIDAYYADLHHETLIEGRLISEGDVLKQRNVIVIDQKTAYALFTGADAIGKTITVDHVDWTIVGIVSTKVRLGETTEGIAYVPITAVAVQQFPMDTLEIRLSATEGTGRAALIQTTLEQWNPGGSFHALEREKYAAFMPLRWAVIVISLICTIILFRWFLKSVKKHYLIYQHKLETHYARQIIVWLIAVILLLLLTGCAAAGLMMFTMKLITAPALIFTDWIPENPVSITSYVTRFWAIHHGNARAIQYISREMSIVMLSSWLIRWGTIATLGGCLITTNKRRNRK